MKHAIASLAAGVAFVGVAGASEVETEMGLDAVAEEATLPVADQGAGAIGQVARSTFTTAVLDREPQDSITSLSNDNVVVFYFTELRDMTGATITHRWEHDGNLMAEVFFDVGGPRWRVYSRKNLEPSWLGDWKVTVLDSTGRTLGTDTFTLSEASRGVEPAAETTAEMAIPSEAAPPAARVP